MKQFLNMFNQAIPKDMSFTQLLQLSVMATMLKTYTTEVNLSYLAASEIKDINEFPKISETIKTIQNKDVCIQMAWVVKYIVGLSMDIQALTDYKNNTEVLNTCVQYFSDKIKLPKDTDIYPVFEMTYQELAGDEKSAIARKIIADKVKRLQTDKANYAKVNYKDGSFCINCNQCIKSNNCVKLNPDDCDFIEAINTILAGEKTNTLPYIDENDLREKGFELNISADKFNKHRNQFDELKKCYTQNAK